MSLEGNIEDLGLADIFQMVGLSKRSGVLTLIRREGSGRLVFNQGKVVYASSDQSPRLGYILVEKNIISNKDLEKGLRFQKAHSQNKPIGTILLEMSIITKETIEAEIQNHILLVVRDLLSWEKGSFHFELGKIITGDIVLSGGLNTDFLLLEGARLLDEENEKNNETEKGSKEGTPQRETQVLNLKVDSSTVTHPQGPSEFKVQLPSPKPSEENSLEQRVKENPTEPKKGRKDLTLLTAMIEELSGPSTGSDITLLVLRYASELMNRAVIFLVREGDIMGLGQFGVVLQDGNENEKIRDILIPLDKPSILSEVIKKKTTYKGVGGKETLNTYLFNQLGGGVPLEVFVAPLLSDGKVIALLYGDNLPAQKQIPETEGLEAFIRVAGFAFGKALLERKIQRIKT